MRCRLNISWINVITSKASNNSSRNVRLTGQDMFVFWIHQEWRRLGTKKWKLNCPCLSLQIHTWPFANSFVNVTVCIKNSKGDLKLVYDILGAQLNTQQMSYGGRLFMLGVSKSSFLLSDVVCSVLSGISLSSATRVKPHTPITTVQMCTILSREPPTCSACLTHLTVAWRTKSLLISSWAEWLICLVSIWKLSPFR